MREYARALAPVVERIPEPDPPKEREPLHGPGCVCEECYTAKMNERKEATT
jgi:hypothetical protein